MPFAFSSTRSDSGPRLWKSLCLAFALTGGTAAALQAGDDQALMAELERAAREAGLDLDLPSWDVSGGIGVGVGHRSNPTLAAYAPDGSAVARVAADALAWRLPQNGVEYVAFFDGTYDHFFSGETERGILTITRGEWRWHVSEGVRLSAGLQHIRQDEVIDASSLESGLIAVRARLHQVGLDTRLTWKVGRDWEVRALIRGENSDYGWPLDDFFSGSSEVVLVRGLRRAGEVSLVAGWLGRIYRDREQAAEGGRPLSGTKLRVRQPRMGLRHAIKGGKAARWSLQTDVAWMGNRDNGSGWYDYDRSAVDLSFEVRKGAWHGTVDAGWLRYLYKVQTVGFGDPPPRKREVWTLSARIEREVGRGIAVFLEGMIEENRSNDPFLDYNDRLVLAGVRWER